MMKAEKRTVFGKKVSTLRRGGMVTGSIFGPGFDSIPVQMNAGEFAKLEKEVGRTSFFDLEVEGKKHAVIIKDTQVHPVTGIVLNVDFYQPSQTEKMTASVPLEFVGESYAIKNNLGFLLTTVSEVDIVCLPKDLPQVIEVDLSLLADQDSTISFKDVVLPKGVEFASSIDLEMSFAMIGTSQKADAEESTEESTEESGEGSEENAKTEE